MSDPAPITPPPTPAPSSPGLGLGINHAIAHAAPHHPKSSPLNDRVGEILGYRLCDNCGFQLMGTPVVREPSYGLLLARCPECGHVHPASEPAQDSKRRSAFAHLASLGLIALKLGVLTLLAMILVSARRSLLYVYIENDRYVNYIYAQYYSHIKQRTEELGDLNKVIEEEEIPQGVISTRITSPNGAVSNINIRFIGESWWLKNRDRILKSYGGPIYALGPRFFREIIFLPITFVILALFLPLFTPQSSRKSHFAILAAGVVLASIWPHVGIYLFPDATVAQQVQVPYSTSLEYVNKQLDPYVSLLFPIPAIFSAALAALFARPLARLVVRGFLRPELRGPFVELWTTAGLNPPRLTWPAHAPRPRTARS